MRKLMSLFALVVFSVYNIYAQTEPVDPKMERFNVGLGIGFDYGGFGGNLLFYPQKNVGLFGGVGYALAGLGYNAGVKGRFFLNEKSPVTPFVMAMYGYNSAIKVKGAAEYNKLFYGVTFGAGIDWRVGAPRKNYLSLAITMPVRNAGEVYGYMDNLEQRGIAKFDKGLPELGFSIGYRMRIR